MQAVSAVCVPDRERAAQSGDVAGDGAAPDEERGLGFAIAAIAAILLAVFKRPTLALEALLPEAAAGGLLVPVASEPGHAGQEGRPGGRKNHAG